MSAGPQDALNLDTLPVLPGMSGGETPEEGEAESWEGDEDGPAMQSLFGSLGPGGDFDEDEEDALGLGIPGVRSPHMREEPPADIDIPLWQEYNTHKNDGQAYRLRVQVEEIGGDRSEIGFMPGHASHQQLILRFRRAGTFWITPFDQNNRPRGQAKRIVIHPDHDFLRKVMGGNGGAPAPMMAGFGGMGAEPVLDFVAKRDRLEAEQRMLEADRLAAKEAELQKQRDLLNARQLDLAAQAADQTAHMMGRVIESEKARSDTHISAMTTMQNGVISRMDASHQQALQFSAQQHAQAMQRAELAMERDRLAHKEARLAEERKIERERQDMLRIAKEQQMWRDEQAAERRRMIEAEAARQREHQQTMLQMQERLMAANNPVKVAMAMAPTAIAGLTFAKDNLGIDIGESLKGLFGANQAKSITETLADVVKTGIQVAGKVASGEGFQDMFTEEPEEIHQVPPQQIAPPPVAIGGPAAMSPIQAQQQAAPQGHPEGVPMSPHGASAPQGVPQSAHAQPQAQGPIPQTPQGLGGPGPVPTPAGPMMPPSELKRARRAVYSMYEELKDADPATWGPILLGKLGTHPDAEVTQTFLKQVGVTRALTEAGAPQDLIQQVLAMVPPAMGIPA